MPPSQTSNKSPNRNSSEGALSLLNLPNDLQVNILTYLRAYDLSAVQKSCRFYSRPELIDNVVSHFAENIYPSEWTMGFDSTVCKPVAAKGKHNNSSKKSAPSAAAATANDAKPLHTFEHLRNMELLVVARVLNSPEPASGFFVSKSWCKQALRWLEVQQEQLQRPKKLSKKKQRLRDRKLSDASPPWPNANIDLLCEHSQLQRCSNGKSARARRRLLDRQAWKILKRLYPDSAELESAMGECLQCTLEAEMAKRNEADRVEQDKLERKRPLANEEIRRFYTRRNGVPTQAVLTAGTSPGQQCPLEHGNYYVLPRSWCHAWRRFIKTGEGGGCSPPDAASLLCHAHRLALLPPHLEAYLYGESTELLVPHGDNINADSLPSVPDVAAAAAVAGPNVVPGQGLDEDSMEALRAAGMGSPVGVREQLSMLRELEEIQQEIQPPAAPAVAAVAGAVAVPGSPVARRNDILDDENYSVVEILTEKEYLALESCWSGQGFGLLFSVSEKGVTFHTTQLCRECDNTGRQHALHIKNRSRKSIRKSADKGRAPASLEY